MSLAAALRACIDARDQDACDLPPCVLNQSIWCAMAAMSRLLVCSLAMAPAQLALGFNCGAAAISAHHARRAVHHSARVSHCR
jgi:hypothetical protein